MGVYIHHKLVLTCPTGVVYMRQDASKGCGVHVPDSRSRLRSATTRLARVFIESRLAALADGETKKTDEVQSSTPLWVTCLICMSTLISDVEHVDLRGNWTLRGYIWSPESYLW
jgi:hypothetical protein